MTNPVPVREIADNSSSYQHNQVDGENHNSEVRVISISTGSDLDSDLSDYKESEYIETCNDASAFINQAPTVLNEHGFVNITIVNAIDKKTDKAIDNATDATVPIVCAEQEAIVVAKEPESTGFKSKGDSLFGDDVVNVLDSGDSTFGNIVDDHVDDHFDATTSELYPHQTMALPSLAVPDTPVKDSLQDDIEAAFAEIEKLQDVISNESRTTKSQEVSTKDKAGKKSKSPPKAKKARSKKAKKKNDVIILDPITCADGQAWHQALGIKLDAFKRVEQECLSELHRKITEHQLGDGVRALAVQQLRDAWIDAVAEKQYMEQERRIARRNEDQAHAAAQRNTVENSYMDRILGPDCEERRLMEEHGCSYEQLTNFNLYVPVCNDEIRRKNLAWARITETTLKEGPQEVLTIWQKTSKVLPLPFVKTYYKSAQFEGVVQDVSHPGLGAQKLEAYLHRFFKTL